MKTTSYKQEHSQIKYAMIQLCFILLIILSMSHQNKVFALNPDEPLADIQLEERARELSKELRCLVCQNQSIDDSDAELASDMRVILREQLLAGKDNQAIKDYFVDRYGAFVLLKPRMTKTTILLWVGPFIVVGVTLALIIIGAVRQRKALSKESEFAHDDAQVTQDYRIWLDAHDNNPREREK